MSKKKTNTCPFCFHECKEWEDNWCCPECNSIIRRDGESGKLPARCPQCGLTSEAWKVNRRTRHCPDCKSIVPEELEECDEVFPIAVVGPTRAGKTHLLTVLAHELLVGGLWEEDYWTAVRVIRRQVVEAQGVQAIEQADEYLKFDEMLYNPINPGGREGTLQGTKKETRTYSLLVELRYKDGIFSRFKEPRKKGRILLAFSDTAGEGFKQGNWHDVAERYPVFKKKAKAIIAVVDPLELGKLRAESEDPNRRMRYIDCGILPDSDEALPTVTTREVLSIPALKKQMPVAWCMTKTDALAGLGKIDPQTPLGNSLGALAGDDGTRKTSGLANIQELKTVSKLTERFILANNDGKKLPKYRYRCFFALDALGTSFHDGRLHKPGPLPRRILDPLLWILWQYGLCGGR